MTWAIPAAISVISAVGQARALNAQGKAEQQAHDYNAKLRNRNAEALDIEAEARMFGEEWAIADFRDDFRELNARAGQAFRKNGWIAESGTAAKVLVANAAEADEEIAMRRWQALADATTTREKGVNERLRAELDSTYGRIARSSRQSQAGTALLGGFSKAYDIYRTA